MSNITLSVDDEIIKKARKIAIDKNTTLTGMIREYLIQVCNSDEMAKQLSINELKQSFETYSRKMGIRNWKRDELYER